MGCVASKPDINDLHANIFQVINVNELGHRFSAAKLEVTDTDLVLYQRGKSAIRWPLRYLRRYGFDAHQFSFESGRRCPTGPGIYSFKCQRAEALFNMLQLQIQNITEDAASQDMAALPPQGVTESRDFLHDDPRNGRTGGDTDVGNYLEPVQRPPRVPNVVGGTSVDLSTVSSVSGVTIVVGSGNAGGVSVPFGGLASTVGGGPRGMGAVHPPASPTTPLGPPPLPLYENSQAVTRSEEAPLNPSHDMRDQLPPTPTEPMRPVFANHVDKTVVCDNFSGRPSFTNSYPSSCISLSNPIKSKRPKSYVNVNKSHNEMNMNDQVYVNIVPEQHVYVNFGQEKDVPAVPPRPSLVAGSAGSGSSHSGTTTTTDTDHQPSNVVNYIILDLDPNSDSSQGPPVSPLGSVVSGTESPHRLAERYVTIDFGKTLALMDTAKAALAWEDGSRKTRHNSTFTNPTTMTHHSSSLSD